MSLCPNGLSQLFAPCTLTKTPLLVARVYVGLEDTNRAFEWMEKAIEARSWECPWRRSAPYSTTAGPIPASPRCSTRSVCRIECVRMRDVGGRRLG